MNARLALLTFIVLPLMVLATWLFARRAQAAFRETRTRVAAVVGDLAEDIAGMRVIQAFAQEDATQERFDEVNQANRDANINAMTALLHLPARHRIPGHAGHRHRAVVRRAGGGAEAK